jgi:pimeloyl-ACP methyl ester carboxylesterase
VPWIGLAGLLAAGLALFVAALIWHTAWTLRHPPRRTTAWALARSLPTDPSCLGPRPPAFVEWSFTAPRAGPFPVWDITGQDPAGPVVIVTHGWGESRVVGLQRSAALASVARRVIAWDLPGHGDSPGLCGLGVTEVPLLLSLIDHVAEPGRGRTPLVLFGSSLGAGVSIAAAAERPGDVAGVIAEAPYRVPMTPARNVLRGAGLPYRLTLRPALGLLGLRLGRGLSWAIDRSAGGFDRAVIAARCSTPLLVLHGTIDEVCPIEDGRAIAGAAPRGRIVEVAGAGHTNLWTQEPFTSRCAEAARDFLRLIGAEAPAGADGTALRATAASPAGR